MTDQGTAREMQAWIYAMMIAMQKDAGLTRKQFLRDIKKLPQGWDIIQPEKQCS